MENQFVEELSTNTLKWSGVKGQKKNQKTVKTYLNSRASISIQKYGGFLFTFDVEKINDYSVGGGDGSHSKGTLVVTEKKNILFYMIINTTNFII